MFIILDFREIELKNSIENLIKANTAFQNIQLKIENLHIGDIIIEIDSKPFIIIERKQISDLLSSLKDGRYTEQSFRLNNSAHHNHNIMYLIEGNINKFNKHKNTIYSSMLSLNFYKGFSVINTISIDETAFFICNSIIKIIKNTTDNKLPFYSNSNTTTILNKTDPNDESETPETPASSTTDKDYVKAIKTIKKNNINTNNISEIMLCQIPGVSPNVALIIMKEFNNIYNLINCLKQNIHCLDNIKISNSKQQLRKLNKTSIENIKKFLLFDEIPLLEVNKTTPIDTTNDILTTL
jgi:ERCC4-type nuclease